MKNLKVCLFILILSLTIISLLIIPVHPMKWIRIAIWYCPNYFLEINNYTLSRIKLYNDFKTYNEIGFTDVLFLVKETDGRIFFNTNVSNFSPPKPFSFDALDLACEMANLFNLNIHTWFVIGIDDFLCANDTYAMLDINGIKNRWVKFYYPDIRNYYLALITELIENYPIKGINLDYIRFPPEYSYDKYTRTIFNDTYGFDPMANPESLEWKEWRKQQVTSLVNEIYTLIKSYNLNKELSCCVFSNPDPPLQNWDKWQNQNVIDFLTFMVYEAPIEFENQLNFINVKWNHLTPFLMGIKIGIYGISALDLDKELEILHKYYDFNGFVIFREQFLTSEFIEIIKKWIEIDRGTPSSPKLWYENPYILAMVLIAVCVCVYFFGQVLRKRAKEPNPKTH